MQKGKAKKKVDYREDVDATLPENAPCPPGRTGYIRPFKEGEIYADVLIVEIEKGVVLFQSIKRTPDGKVLKVAKYGKKGEVIGEQMVWEDTIRRMSYADFSSFIKERKKHFILTI